jgi:L-asparagine oxygenase
MIAMCELSPNERVTLWEASEEVAAAGPSAVVGDRLPPRIRAEVEAFARDSGLTGVLLLRGLELGHLPPTHVNGEPTQLPDHGTAGSMMHLAEALGMMIGYEDEKQGALVHDVVPLPGEEDRVEGSGAVPFDFHIENAHHPLRPDFIGLVCLRQDHDGLAATRVASCRKAVNLLSPVTCRVLRTCQFFSHYPGSFTREVTEEPAPVGPHPVLFGAVSRPFMRFNSHNTTCVSKSGRAALREFTEALEQVCQDITLSPGDCAIIDNNVTAHGRTAFTPRFDGQDRWLRRFYSIGSIPSTVEQMMNQPRVIPEIPAIKGLW